MCDAGPAGCRAGRDDPVLTEFQALIDTDPVVRMHVHQMVDQAPLGKPHRKRHLHSLEQMLRQINEVLTMAPEFGENAVVLRLCAIFDWTMGTPAGFAAFRDPRINTMLKKILTVWCGFLGNAGLRYVLNDSPSGWKCPRPARRSASNSSNTTPRSVLGFAQGAGKVASHEVAAVATAQAGPNASADAAIPLAGGGRNRH
jgi:hypothetical protein